MANDIVEHCNKTVWHIPQLVLPKHVDTWHDSVIEVDPDYV